jgi:hypothetical protein
VIADMTHTHFNIAAIAVWGFALSACGGGLPPGSFFPPRDGVMATSPGPDVIPAPVIRQPVLPEYLVACRGHVLVPALGMTFVPRAGALPTTGQYLREESLTPPYRVIRPNDRTSQDRNPQRLNVELDRFGRIIGLACG